VKQGVPQFCFLPKDYVDLEEMYTWQQILTDCNNAKSNTGASMECMPY
jgi:hypothetical protein